MNRRNFLRCTTIAVAALSGAAVVACGARADATTDARALAQPELLVALGADTVRGLGRRYRDLVPAERDAAALRAAILASRPLSERLGLTQGSMPEQIRRDFSRGQTVVLDGWLLAQTEARQCALYSLESA
jgi:hypothetical protein